MIKIKSIRKCLRFIKRKYYYNKTFIYENTDNAKWVYISYIPEALFLRKDSSFLDSHQNKREMMAIFEAFRDDGYNCVIERFDKKKQTVNYDYDIVFGLEPNFIILSNLNPNAKKVYYATGCYCKHQNEMIIERTNHFNLLKKQNVRYSRLVELHNACSIADSIIQIGSKFTIGSYTPEIRAKITLLDQSSNLVSKFDINEKLKLSKNTHFVWIGGTGSILKGLDMVLDVFMENKDLHLDVFGSVDPDFDNYIQSLGHIGNINFHGFVNVNSNKFHEVIKYASFFIYPTASDGCPGSMIVAMKLGLIPITSIWGAFDEIEKYGYLLKDLSTESIQLAIDWSKSLSEKQKKALAMENIHFAENKWSLSDFPRRFKDALTEVLTK